jgi:hypothetical protein
MRTPTARGWLGCRWGRDTRRGHNHDSKTKRVAPNWGCMQGHWPPSTRTSWLEAKELWFSECSRVHMITMSNCLDRRVLRTGITDSASGKGKLPPGKKSFCSRYTHTHNAHTTRKKGVQAPSAPGHKHKPGATRWSHNSGCASSEGHTQGAAGFSGVCVRTSKGAHGRGTERVGARNCV